MQYKKRNREVYPMNEKEIAELRRRFRPDKSGISRVCGCYVNEQGGDRLPF